MEKVKTATVTWINYNNCGTYLQAYALQHVVLSFGYENHILNDAPHFIDPRPVWRKALSWLWHKLVARPPRVMRRVNGCYARFSNDWLKIDRQTADLARVSNRYDTFLCGSDQIWSPIIKPVNPYFFLYFTDKKKVAYAPSLGSTTASDEWRQVVQPLLQQFAHLSVREQQGAALLSEMLHRDVPAVVDPTLLLTADDWQPLCAERVVPDGCKYLFCYLLTNNPVYLDVVRRYAGQHGLELVLMGLHPEYEGQAGHVLWGGPSEFLSAVRHADVVMTDSFHATVFSILFKKQFYTFQRFKAGAWNNQNSRLENLLGKLAIKGRFVTDGNFDNVPPIDYDKALALLEAERAASLRYLSSSLKN